MKARIETPRLDRGSGVDFKTLQRLQANLAKADQKIATLTSELERKQASVSALLFVDLRSSAELARLIKLVWQIHNEGLGGCSCDVCAEFDQSRNELAGLL